MSGTEDPQVRQAEALESLVKAVGEVADQLTSIFEVVREISDSSSRVADSIDVMANNLDELRKEIEWGQRRRA